NCPSCGTRYQADDANFSPPGRNVRCAKCGHIWFQSVQEPPAEPEGERIIAAPPPLPPREDPPIAPTVPYRADIDEHRERRSMAGWVAWLLLIGLIAALGYSFIRYREIIAVYWPQSASVYAFIGMPVNVRGLDFSDIHYSTKMEDGEPVLAVEGNLVN